MSAACRAVAFGALVVSTSPVRADVDGASSGRATVPPSADASASTHVRARAATPGESVEPPPAVATSPARVDEQTPDDGELTPGEGVAAVCAGGIVATATAAALYAGASLLVAASLVPRDEGSLLLGGIVGVPVCAALALVPGVATGMGCAAALRALRSADDAADVQAPPAAVGGAMAW